MSVAPNEAGDRHRALASQLCEVQLPSTACADTSPFTELRLMDPSVQIVTYQQRQNSKVGRIIFQGKELFFKQRSSELLAIELNAVEIVEKLGFSTPKAINVLWGAKESIVLQEYIPEIASRQLTSLIDSSSPRDARFLGECFRSLYEASRNSLCMTSAPASNDRFLTDRASPGGRIATLYSSYEFDLAGVRTTFSSLLDSRFVVDGVSYKETFGELFAKVKAVLSPKTIRPLWVSHGDIIETNIYQTYDQIKPWGMIDLEVTGMNWALGDVVIPLVATAYMFDYTLPRYSPFDANRLAWNEKPVCEVSGKDGVILFENVDGFHCSDGRLSACCEYLTQCAYPLLEDIQRLGGRSDYAVAEQLQAIFFMRFIGAHDISRWSSNDQARAFALMFKLCGTPVGRTPQHPLATFEAML